MKLALPDINDWFPVDDMRQWHDLVKISQTDRHNWVTVRGVFRMPGTRMLLAINGLTSAHTIRNNRQKAVDQVKSQFIEVKRTMRMTTA
jgi:hypothetical protein